MKKITFHTSVKNGMSNRSFTQEEQGYYYYSKHHKQHLVLHKSTYAGRVRSWQATDLKTGMGLGNSFKTRKELIEFLETKYLSMSTKRIHDCIKVGVRRLANDGYTINHLYHN